MTELLCIQTHSQRIVEAGNIYMGFIVKCGCGCGNDKVVTGGLNPNGFMTCVLMGRVYSSSVYELDTFLFAQIGAADECEQYREKMLIENQPSGAK